VSSVHFRLQSTLGILWFYWHLG